jgi:hypothetical protein
MQINTPDNAPDYHQMVDDHRPGRRRAALLLTGKENALNYYRMALSEGGTENWTAPRHRHTKEQFRFILSGDYQIHKDQMMPAGWCAYFPESVYYGPQVKSTNMKMLILQFGGPSGFGYPNAEQMGKASAALEARGTFSEGLYHWVDEDGKHHRHDAAQAVEEEAFGEKFAYPEARYNDVVLMNPDAFTWVEQAEAPGVYSKHLGTFTERDVRFCFYRLDKGATITFGTQPSPEALFLKEGVVTCNNRLCEKETAFGTETEDGPVQITAVEPSEMLYIKLPTF